MVGGFTFNCTQATSDQLKVGDCFDIDTAVVDSEFHLPLNFHLFRHELISVQGVIRPMAVVIPALSGLVISSSTTPARSNF
jgi:hypothetical protein